MRLDFENVGDYHSTEADSGLLSLLCKHAFRSLLFFVASVILAWFWFTNIAAVRVPDKKFILVGIGVHGLNLAIQVLVAVIVWIHFVQVLASCKQQLRGVLYFSE